MKIREEKQGAATVWSFECPACPVGHRFRSKMPNGSEGWSFNGNLDLPTFSPSLLVQFQFAGKDYRCHSFVRDGRIEFLSDCTHELAGQTVDLPDIETEVL